MGKLAKITDKKANQTPETDPERECIKLQALAQLANRNPERIPKLRDYLRDHPELHRYITCLAGAVKEGVLEKMVTGAGSRILLEAHLQEVQQKLYSPNPSAVERLLVEAVMMCWLRVQYAELRRTQAMSGGVSFREIELAEKVLTQSYSRYTRALSHLAKVQRLSLPKSLPKTESEAVDLGSAGGTSPLQSSSHLFKVQ
jgi:hypothetical protein